jgi:ABC-type transport system involved in cytochrome c biogenesis permease subunit
MMNVISIFIGLVALIAAFVAFIPLLGWLNWLVIPVVAIGLVLGLLSNRTTGRNINLAVLAIAMFRLFIGGGLL